MTEKKTFKACFSCPFPECTCTACKKRYEPCIDSVDASVNKKRIVLSGKEYNYEDAAQKLGLKRATLYTRVYNGWNEQQIKNTALRKRKPTLVFNGEKYTYKQLAKIVGISAQCLHRKMNREVNPLTIEEILDPAKRKQRLAKA
jgi:DNA-binding XRE family transcriptional regulator